MTKNVEGIKLFVDGARGNLSRGGVTETLGINKFKVRSKQAREK